MFYSHFFQIKRKSSSFAVDIDNSVNNYTLFDVIGVPADENCCCLQEIAPK